MPKLSRRGFVASAVAAATFRAAQPIGSGLKARPILTLVYDKSLGMMRAVERIVWR